MIESAARTDRKLQRSETSTFHSSNSSDFRVSQGFFFCCLIFNFNFNSTSNHTELECSFVQKIKCVLNNVLQHDTSMQLCLHWRQSKIQLFLLFFLVSHSHSCKALLSVEVDNSKWLCKILIFFLLIVFWLSRSFFLVLVSNSVRESNRYFSVSLTLNLTFKITTARDDNVRQYTQLNSPICRESSYRKLQFKLFTGRVRKSMK